MGNPQSPEIATRLQNLLMAIDLNIVWATNERDMIDIMRKVTDVDAAEYQAYCDVITSLSAKRKIIEKAIEGSLSKYSIRYREIWFKSFVLNMKQGDIAKQTFYSRENIKRIVSSMREDLKKSDLSTLLGGKTENDND